MRLLVIALCLIAAPVFANPNNLTEQWHRVLEKTSPVKRAAAKDKLLALKRVQFSYLKYKYKEDFKNYGKSDYWASPQEFKKKRSGDCEDFAIAKYFDLLERGFRDEDMKITVIMDKNTPHAVLVVNVDGNKYILDNLTPGRVVKSDNIYPLYEANQKSERFYANGRKLLKERTVASPLRWK